MLPTWSSFNLPFEPLQYIRSYLWEVAYFKIKCDNSQIWHNLLLWNISWFQYWFDVNNLEISGYDLIPLDHQSNSKLGGDCIFCKSFLPLRVCNIRLLDECINFELKIGDKLYRFVALYRSPSQTWDEFLSFSHNFEVNLERFQKTVRCSY